VYRLNITYERLWECDALDGCETKKYIYAEYRSFNEERLVPRVEPALFEDVEGKDTSASSTGGCYCEDFYL
jgi:hypothetical protein